VSAAFKQNSADGDVFGASFDNSGARDEGVKGRLGCIRNRRWLRRGLVAAKNGEHREGDASEGDQRDDVFTKHG
jgi:hypothetical protein